jgi:hypothetical protein
MLHERGKIVHARPLSQVRPTRLIQATKDFDLIGAAGLGHMALRTPDPVNYGLRRQYDFLLTPSGGRQDHGLEYAH